MPAEHDPHLGQQARRTTGRVAGGSSDARCIEWRPCAAALAGAQSEPDREFVRSKS
jgi:hypothetical protein